MSKFKALLKFIGIGALIGAVLGYIMANSKYGTGVIYILGGTTGWGTEEEQGVSLFWLLIQAGIFFGICYLYSCYCDTNKNRKSH